MQMILKYSDVRYNDTLHTYTRPDGLLLSGITGMIDRQINGGKFAKLSDDFLRPYAEYGSLVHSEIEQFHTIGIEPTTPEAKAWIKWYFDSKFIVAATEYTVTDDEHFATNIDFVSYEIGTDGITLFDFKTSSVIDLDSLSWQLSICAELFNIQNGFYPSRLLGVHLRDGNCDVVEIQRKPTEAVFRLLEAEINGEQYIEQETEGKAEIRQLFAIEQALVRIKQEAELFEQQKKELLERLESEMDLAGLKKIETDTIIITKVLPSTSTTIDTARMKKELSDYVWKPYEKQTERKGYIKITLK